MTTTADFRLAPSLGSDPARSPSDVEAEHLRHLIEKQPCCLLRVGLDALVLAANDAAMAQLGARESAQVLARLFTDWIIPEHRDGWHEFAARIRDSGSGSAECDLVGLEGARYRVLMRGVWLANHPDGIGSMILVVRDISATSRLEQVVEEHAATRQALADARQQLDREAAERQALVAATEERKAANQRLLADRTGLQALADEHQLALLLKEREARQHLATLQSKLDWAEGERLRLNELLEERERRDQALVSGLDAKREELERDLASAKAERDEALGTLSDQRVELRSLVEALSGDARALLLRCEEMAPDRLEDPAPPNAASTGPGQLHDLVRTP